MDLQLLLDRQHLQLLLQRHILQLLLKRHLLQLLLHCHLLQLLLDLDFLQLLLQCILRQLHLDRPHLLLHRHVLRQLLLDSHFLGELVLVVQVYHKSPAMVPMAPPGPRPLGPCLLPPHTVS